MTTTLYLWVEGFHDENFAKILLKPLFESMFDYVKIIKWAQNTKKFIKKMIQFINSDNSSDYILFTDLDEFPCVTRKKEKICMCHSILDPSKIIVIKKEIESWYMAGINDENYDYFKLPRHFSSTNNLTKEKFDDLIPQEYLPKKNFLIEILERFSIDIARVKNHSFNYFFNRFFLE